MNEANLYEVGATGCATAWADEIARHLAIPGGGVATSLDLHNALSVLIQGLHNEVARTTVAQLTITDLVQRNLFTHPFLLCAGTQTPEPELPLDDTGKLLAERGKTHGDWHTQATITNSLKQVLRAGPNWHKMPAVVQEALDMVATKLGRMVSGNAAERDHFDDAIGYLRLARDGGHK